ncbi:DUF1566 domain-containing protein [Vibrio owensii]|uniref:Lcl domain-containing protein n=1 Tax=Vibrio owensii TaxID=696485 RepID=UPI003AAB248C
MFTSSPSVAYLDSIGGSSTNGTSTETSDPVGDFYTFDWPNANTLCATYSTQSLAGRNNWRLPSAQELQTELVDRSIAVLRSWPLGIGPYWTMTPLGSSYYFIDLESGFSEPTTQQTWLYVSCVSEP